MTKLSQTYVWTTRKKKKAPRMKDVLHLKTGKRNKVTNGSGTGEWWVVGGRVVTVEGEKWKVLSPELIGVIPGGCGAPSVPSYCTIAEILAWYERIKGGGERRQTQEEIRGTVTQKLTKGKA